MFRLFFHNLILLMGSGAYLHIQYANIYINPCILCKYYTSICEFCQVFMNKYS